MIKLCFHLSWLWLKRDILLLCLCVFPDPHPAGSPGTGLFRARADLPGISLAERLCWGFSGFSFLSFPLTHPTSRLLWMACGGQEGGSVRQAGMWCRRVGEAGALPFPTHWKLLPLAGGGCPPTWSSVPPFHPAAWSEEPQHTSSVRCPLPLLLFLEVQGRHEATLGQVLTWNSHFPGRRHETTRGQVLPAVKAGTFCLFALVQSFWSTLLPGATRCPAYLERVFSSRI